MARGIDLPEVQLVINYDTPQHIKSHVGLSLFAAAVQRSQLSFSHPFFSHCRYVHRVGRTARAGRSGSSYTLLRRDEVYHFKTMLQVRRCVVCVVALRCVHLRLV